MKRIINNMTIKKSVLFKKIKFSILFFTILLICNKSYSQSLGFAENECGIDLIVPYHFDNYTLPHYDYYNLYHGSTLIYSQGANYSPLYQGVLLRFVNDSTGFFISYWLDGYKFNVFKINGNSVNQIGGAYPPSNLYDFFVINEHLAYLVTGAQNHVCIYKCTDNIPSIALIYNNTTGTTVYDTISDPPLCDSLNELNFLYNQLGDTLIYKIIFHVNDSITHIQKNNKSDWYIFPNPADEKLYINIDETATIEIININGQIIDTIVVFGNTKTIDISKLKSGFYTLRIKTGKGIAIRKLIKK